MDPRHRFEPDVALLGHPFDQFQRYQDIRVVLDIIQSHLEAEPLKILDVGGSPIAARFLKDYRVVTLNPEIEPGVLLQADGIRLPFPNESFDVVITVDTLEHVKEPWREAFVAELLRVSRVFTIITGPFANGFNELAEATLNEFVVKVLYSEHRFLSEHLENGLPDLDACLGWISTRSKNHLAIPSGYIHHWLPLMVIKHYLGRLSNSGSLSVELDRFYNYHRYWNDHRWPSYRQVVIASRGGETGALAQVAQTFEAPETVAEPDLNGVMALWQALRWLQMIEERDHRILQLETQVAYLRAFIRKIEDGRVMRLMARFNQLKGFFVK